jgi:hypothetical protein
VNVANAAAELVLNGILSRDGGITKTGGGTLELGGSVGNSTAARGR